MIISNITGGISSVSKVKAMVELYEGSTLVKTCTCSDVLQDFTLSREGDNSKFFGYGVSHKLSLKLIDLARELNLSTNNTIKIALGDGTTFDNPYPTFYITEVSRDEDSNTITATAYDIINQASQHTVSELNINAPYTIRDIAVKCANLLGITNVVSQNVADGVFSTNYPNGANLDGTENIRQVLNQIAEATQTIYFISYQNQLVFKRLDKDGDAVFTINRNSYFEMHTKTNRRLTALCSATELGDNIEANTGETGTTQYIRNNPFWELRDDIATLLNNALSNVAGLTINQFDCDWIGNYLLEIGDKIGLVTEDGSIINTYLLSDTVNYDGVLNEITEWEYSENSAETPSNPVTIGERISQTTARVDKVNKEIELLVSDVEDNKSQISQIKLDLDGIDLTVSEAVKTEMDSYNIDDLKEQVTTNTSNIGQLRVDLNGITAKVSSNETKITTLETETGELESTTESHTEQISALQINSNSISATVSTLETSTVESIESLSTDITSLRSEVDAKVTAEDVTISIKNEMANGVTKVETETGFTFNNEGLTIEKSGKEMKTQITEDGMTVFKDSTAVLTANNTGVDAKNLRASTYLIIGTRSRFEDFGSNRTACFWIGG